MNENNFGLKKMKNSAFEELKSMALDEHRRRWPMTPEPARYIKPFSDKNSNELTKSVLAYLRLKGCFASRLNNGGIYDTRLNRYRPGTNRKGLPDILCTLPDGKSLFLEIKHGADKMSEFQERIRDEQTQCNGIYQIVRNFPDFKSWFDENCAVKTPFESK